MSEPGGSRMHQTLAFLLASALSLPADSVRAEPVPAGGGSASGGEARTSTLRTQAGLESATKSGLEDTLNSGLEEPPSLTDTGAQEWELPKDWPPSMVVSVVRLRKEWTRQDLSAASGVSTNHISELEDGTVLPSAETAEKLARALGIDFNDFSQRVSAARSQPRRLPPFPEELASAVDAVHLKRIDALRESGEWRDLTELTITQPPLQTWRVGDLVSHRETKRRGHIRQIGQIPRGVRVLIAWNNGPPQMLTQDEVRIFLARDQESSPETSSPPPTRLEEPPQIAVALARVIGEIVRERKGLEPDVRMIPFTLDEVSSRVQDLLGEAKRAAVASNISNYIGSRRLIEEGIIERDSPDWVGDHRKFVKFRGKYRWVAHTPKTPREDTAGLEEGVLARVMADGEVLQALAQRGWAKVPGGYVVEADFTVAEPLVLQTGLGEPEGLPKGVPVIRADEPTVGGMIRFLRERAPQLQGGYNAVFSTEYFDLKDAQAAIPLTQPMPGSVLLAPGIQVNANQLGAAFLISKRTGTIYVIQIFQFTSPNWKKPLFYIRAQA